MESTEDRPQRNRFTVARCNLGTEKKKREDGNSLTADGCQIFICEAKYTTVFPAGNPS